MTVRTIIASVGIAIALAVQVGCVERGPSAAAPPVGDSAPVIVTANAEIELQKRKSAGKASWTIAYNGLCNGAPALGFFQRFEPAGATGTVKTIDGVEFVVEKEVADLTGKWGSIFIRCIHPASGELTAEFAAQAPPGQKVD